MLALYTARNIVQTAVIYKSMAADQRALASIEIDINQVPEGQVSFF